MLAPKAENTAAIVWRYLSTRKTTPLFWNSFPFHPHPENSREKNRAPTSVEIDEGVVYLAALHRLYQPRVVAGIGKAGLKCAQRAFPDADIRYIRHPSYGGKREFSEGMDEIM